MSIDVGLRLTVVIWYKDGSSTPNSEFGSEWKKAEDEVKAEPLNKMTIQFI